MTIYGISNKAPLIDNRKVTKKVNQSKAFELPMEAAEEKAVGQSSTGKINNINPFITLNEIENSEIEKEFLKERGRSVINCLKAVRIGILNGEFNEAQLLNLTHEVSALSFDFKSEAMGRLIEEIKLRAEVELAKLQKNLILCFQ